MDNTEVAITTSADLIIDTKLKHYNFNEGLFYGICEANPQLFYNYSTIILEKNNILVEKLKKIFYFKTFQFNNDFTITTNVQLANLILKNKENNEIKKFVLEKKIFDKFSIFFDYIGQEQSEYTLELDENIYYNLVSYFGNIKTGYNCIDSLDYIGANDTAIIDILNGSKFYTKKFQNMEIKGMCLSSCFIYGVNVFLEYATPIQKILYSIFNQICLNDFDLNHDKTLINTTLTFQLGIYSITFEKKNIYIYNLENTDILHQKIELEYYIYQLMPIPKSDLFIVETIGHKMYIIAYQNNGHFEVLGNYNSNIEFVTWDNIIKYATWKTGHNFLYLIENYVVLIKADIWKLYYLDRDIIDNAIADSGYQANLHFDIFEDACEVFYKKYFSKSL